MWVTSSIIEGLTLCIDRYDGGDCCSCTITAAGRGSASASAPPYFNCVDPAAACVGEENGDDGSDVAEDAQQRYSSSGRAASASDEGSTSRLLACVEQWFGDGTCDDVNNSAECRYASRARFLFVEELSEL